VLEPKLASGGISQKRDQELLKDESNEITEMLRAASLDAQHKVVLDQGRWAAARDEVIREAIRQRYTRDARFKKIVDTARAKNKYLLYYEPGGQSNMGGERRADGTVLGQNRLGIRIMEVAGFPGFAR
jgi:predicted NAD-dependent protein-ADP-ribosyltransferase YbiA (DUF1768 family)